MESIEGVDYIFDRFAYLGLSTNASPAKIRRTIARRRAENHPDKLERLGPEVKAKAAEVTEKLDRCATILLNDELRPLYIDRLNWFKENQPELVRTDGNPVIVIGSGRIDLQKVLDGQEFSLDKAEPLVRQMTGYNPKQTELLKKLYQADPANDELRQSYREAVGSKLDYLTQMEMQAWVGAGIQPADTTRGHVLYADEYASAAEKAIEHTRDVMIPQAVAQRRQAVAIGVAKAPLLLTFNGGAAAAQGDAAGMTEQIAQEVAETASANFNTAAAGIRHYAKLKEETLTELVSLSTIHMLHRPEPLPDGLRRVFLLKEGEEGQEPSATAMFHFMFSAQHKSLKRLHAFTTPIPLSRLQNRTHRGPSVAIVHNPAISSMLMEPTYAVEKLHEPVRAAAAPAVS
jgi:hypothetical protein